MPADQEQKVEFRIVDVYEFRIENEIKIYQNTIRKKIKFIDDIPNIDLSYQTLNIDELRPEPPTIYHKWDDGIGNYVIDPSCKDAKINQLWLAAKKYQEQQIDANGLVGMAIKGMQGGLKATENLNWVNSIWDEYYARKLAVNADYTIPLNVDYTALGNLPHSFYEAMSEA